ncbi:MAG: hypothetical protein JW818_08875 [Pirellulales bacterium]|nr:hypothetical protein [Pirellulales bacterium]
MILIPFEWHELGLTDLVSPSDVPDPAWTFVQCYGVRHQTVDLPESVHRFERYHGSCAVLEGTKIGGVALKSPPPPPEVVVPERPAHGPFLCTLGSIECMSEWPYPWIDEPEPIRLAGIPLSRVAQRDSLYWGDAGTLNFYLEKDGSVSWDMLSY